ncbi:hypothetical protein Pint_14844 [Pistacia integerrima]|uniref:Uncharacterized protein n=1 Tax=Pistacia integerrima TaxID=434235 RepID=A0ACC0ZBW6_9ROSI|nr:hypothetical protein Pint_14844 [Pistacia integerrima]
MELKSSEREMHLYDTVCRFRFGAAFDSYYVACEAFSEQQHLRLSSSVAIGVKIKNLL